MFIPWRKVGAAGAGGPGRRRGRERRECLRRRRRRHWGALPPQTCIVAGAVPGRRTYKGSVAGPRLVYSAPGRFSLASSLRPLSSLVSLPLPLSLVSAPLPTSQAVNKPPRARFHFTLFWFTFFFFYHPFCHPLHALICFSFLYFCCLFSVVVILSLSVLPPPVPPSSPSAPSLLSPSSALFS